MQRNRFTILKSLTTLRQMARHPGLVDPAHDAIANAKIEVLAEQLIDDGNAFDSALTVEDIRGLLT